MPRRRIAKALVLEAIAAGYPRGYGPRDIARILGCSYKTVQGHATAAGIKVGTTRPKRPANPPPEFMAVLLKHGFGR